MEKTLFQKIIDREIPATIEYEDDLVIAIRDIQPSAELHLLVIPKKPIPTVNDLTDADASLVGHVYLVARDLARRFNVAESGYRVVSNVNADGGQTVFHLHFHLLGGQPLGRMNAGKDATHGADVTTATPSTAFTRGVVTGGILRDGGILLLAAIGLAIAFNAMNPKQIAWLKKTYDVSEATDADLSRYLAGEAGEKSDTPPEPPSNPVRAPEPNASAPAKPAAPETATPAAPDPGRQAQTPVPSSTSAQPSAPEFTPEPGLIREITYSAFKAFLKKPHYLIDARRPEAYAEGYIADAKNIYGGEVQGNIPMILEMVPRDRVILIYCDGGDECELSHHVADVLKEFGYGPMFIYKGGWNEWILKNK